MKMRIAQKTQLLLTALTLMLSARLANLARTDSTDEQRDRGDVPGWVMITVMTAIVVIALLAVFKEQVLNAVQNAFDSVSNAK
jgi:hypothetical protein